MAYAAGETCFSTPNNGTTVYSSTDASALQNAVDAASAGGTVKVAGTCAGVQVRANITQTVYISKTLTLAGGYTTTNWITAFPITQPTTLDAQGTGRVVFATASAPLALRDLIVQNGYSTGNGGGAYFSSSTMVTGTTFTLNTATAIGGGAYFVYTNSVTATTFTSNTAQYGGGAYFGSMVSMTATTFTSNTAQYGSGVYFNKFADVTVV